MSNQQRALQHLIVRGDTVQKTIYKPRNDNVLVRKVSVGQTPGGLRVADDSAEGVEYYVEAYGPDVMDLDVGDRVLMVGVLHRDFDFMPNSKDLLLIKQGNIIMVYGKPEEEAADQPQGDPPHRCKEVL